MADLLHALAGIAGLVALAWLMSENRRAVPWRAIVVGLGLQVLLGIVFLRFSPVKTAFLKINDALLVLERATQAGTSLVFGYLGGGPAPFAISDAASNFVLAFRALPIVLLISALSALLFYWGVLPALVRGISWLLERSMRVGGVVGLSTAANVFVGMVEAPLFVRPYLARVSRGELFALMVAGMASRNCTRASKPPAEAPIPTTQKAGDRRRTVRLDRRAAARRGTAFKPFCPFVGIYYFRPTP